MSLGFRLRLFVASVLLLLVPFFLVDAFVLRAETRNDSVPLVALGALFAVIAAAILTAVSSRWIGRELQGLTAAALRMGHGDLHIRTGIGGDNAVAQLASALDRLAASLSSTMGELRGERDLVASILDGMQEGVLLLDAKGHIALVNRALDDILLLREGVVGRSFIDVVRHSVLVELLDKARAGAKPRSAEIELGGLKPRRLLVRASPLASDPRSLVAVFVDVTDLRRLESMRRDFVANVSHELRTPVTAVLSAAETLASGALSDPVAGPKFLGVVQRNAERLRSLIDDLLDLSRIESKEFRLRVMEVDLAALFQQITLALRAPAEARGVTLATVIDGTKKIVSDPRAIEQVLTNLIENAVKYCPGARVTLSSKARADGGVEMSVSDTGPGIEPRHLERIFERFYRVDAGRSRELGGTGLGLSIVKHLVEALGGTVAITSTVGEGTTFTIELPSRDGSGPRLPSV